MRPDAAPPIGEITRLLRNVREGDDEALGRVIPHVYDELRAIARRQLRREREGHTLSATALVHEAWARLAAGGLAPTDRSHFLALASRSMRQVLVDHARRTLAQKRGGGWERTTLGDGAASLDVDPAELVALDQALEQLEPRQRQVVEFRFFGGLQESEIAEALGVTERTVRRDWVKARAWLYRTLYPEDAGSTEEQSAPL